MIDELFDGWPALIGNHAKENFFFIEYAGEFHEVINNRRYGYRFRY